MQTTTTTGNSLTLRHRERCPICDGGLLEHVHQEPFDSPALSRYFENHYQGRANTAQIAGLDYQLARCGACEFSFQKTVPGDLLLEEIYDQWLPYSALQTLRDTYTLDTYRYWAEQVEFLIQHLNRRPPDIRVLDFGFGWAGWAQMAKGYGCEVYGTELSVERIDHALTLGINIVPFQSIPSNRFHFINTEQVFEHLVEPLPVLRQLATALEIGGLLKISVPDASIALKRLRSARGFSGLAAADIMPIAPLEHLNCFEHRSLLALARQANLRSIRPSLRLLFNSASGWMHFPRAARLLTRPLYRFVYPKSTFLYFTKDS